MILRYIGVTKLSILPNIITSFRILGGASLIFLEPLTVAFFVIYTLSGISDVLDGYFARKFNAISKLGTTLDSIADILFYSVMLFKIAPLLFKKLPSGIWIAVGAVIIIRIASYLLAAMKYRRFASLHTYLNKLTGVTMFTVPYFIKFHVGTAICITVCTIAALASVEELIIHLKSKEYDCDTKSILKKA